jgi:DNA-binding transcriptional MerR regulator
MEEKIFKDKSTTKRRTRTPLQKRSEASSSMPKYTIGVVSQLLGLPPQMLRRYEEAGLLEPARQSGKNRLYSDEDVAMLEEIVELYEQGVNAAGIRYILQMRRHVRVLQQEIKEVREAQLRVESTRLQVDMNQEQSDE